MVERVPSNLQVLSSFECLGAITAFTHAVERWRAAGLSGIERLDTAIRRGTSVATLSASEGSLLRCATAVSSEARDDRATNPAYLIMNAGCPTYRDHDLEMVLYRLGSDRETRTGQASVTPYIPLRRNNVRRKTGVGAL